MRVFVNLPIQYKILSCFVVIAVVSVLLVSLLIFTLARDIILEKSVAQSSETLKQLSMNVEHNVRLINEKLSVLAHDTVVQAQLELERTRAEGQTSLSEERNMSRVMVHTYYSPIMKDIAIYANNGHVFRIASTRKDERDYSKSLEKARTENGKNVIINEVGQGDVQVVKEINDTTTVESLGVLRVALKKSAIESITREVVFDEGGIVVLLDENNQVIVGDGSYVEPDVLARFTAQSGNLPYRIKGVDCCLLYQKSSYTDWVTVGIMPVDLLSKDISRLRWVSLMAALVIILCCVLLTQSLRRMIVNPLKEMLAVLKLVSGGDFSVKVKLRNQADEIGELAGGINTMIARIDNLITDVYRNELLKKESEFKALQAQINPHFLYNTLDTINWMAKKEGMDGICSMVQAVGDLMRISISNKNSFIPVQDELKYVEDYLFIQKMRYRDRINASLNVDPRLLRQRIPKLILQPIVENAVVHGIEGSRKQCGLRVEGLVCGECAVFVVEDTGVGMTREQIEGTLGDSAAPLDTSSHTGIGIATVQRRIQYLYGEEFGLTIESRKQAWTRVTIRIPFGRNADEYMMEDMGRMENG